MAKITTALTAWRAVSDAASRFGTGYVAPLRRFHRLYAERHFSPHEIYLNDLLNPEVPDTALANYPSREDLIALDAQHVLPGYLSIVADKAMLYSLCRSAQVPVPSLYGVFDLPSGWTPDGRALSTRRDWENFLDTLPGDFIVKPALGLQGRGVTALRREGHEFIDHMGHRRTTAELYDFLAAQDAQNLFATSYAHHSLKIRSGSHKAIIQQRMISHPAIREMTGSIGLCTCRLPTLCVPGRPAEIVGCAMRLIAGANVVDNLGHNTDGNLWCSVDAASGRITEAFSSPDNGKSLRRVRLHPSSRSVIVDFQVPCWEAACKLALRVADVFRPQGLITWDIGIAESGPVVIEGNVGGGILPSPMNRSIRTLIDRDRG